MSLIEKYDVPAPRYTSYPTVPYWTETPSQEAWKQLVKESFLHADSHNGISLYIHLPFCESLCTYCACNTRITVNHGVEEPYLNALLKEWKLYVKLFNRKPKIKELHLGGGTPTFFSADNLQQLIKGILNEAIISKDAEFSFEGHPNNTSAEHLQTLYNLGFRRVSFGVQDQDQKVQEAINRIQPLSNLKRVVKEAREIGYTSVNFDLVYGLPFQTTASVTKTIKEILTLKPERIAFYSYAHVPWLKPGQRKFTEKDLPLGKEKRKLYELGLSFFKKAGYENIGMDHFALKTDSLYQAFEKKELHRNFMGYTSQHTRLMVGLGASSISDSWTGFVQNIKTVEEYQQEVNKGNFPIFKGHVLTEEDRLLRQHILDLMCRYETKWTNNNYYFPVINEILKRCKSLKSDGLIRPSLDGLVVTEEGKPFLRNICMCFDNRYWKKLPQSQAFSSVA
jgi:oxygen-independent coproporphyrinogen III oxidase